MNNGRLFSTNGLTTYVAGVELAFISRKTYVFNIIICEKKKKSLQPVYQLHNTTFEEISPLLKKVSGVHLVITGRVVLFRRLHVPLEKNRDVIKYILPDVHTQDFIAQYQAIPEMQFGAIIRKDVYKPLLELFANAKIYLDTVLIGPYILNLFPMITESNDVVLDTLNYQVPYQDVFMAVIIEKEIKEIPEPKKFQVDRGELNAYCIPSLCACMNAEIDFLKVAVTDDPETARLTNEAKQKRRFKRLLSITVPIIFAIVTTNFFFNQHLSEKRNQYDEELALNQQKLAEINKLEKDIEGKKTLLGKRSGNQGPVLSIIGDQLASTVPAKIKLKNLEIFPMAAKIQKEKPMSFTYNKVLVEGISLESDVLDAWIKKCRQMQWVKDVLLVKYNYDNENKGNFKIELILQ